MYKVYLREAIRLDKGLIRDVVEADDDYEPFVDDKRVVLFKYKGSPIVIPLSNLESIQATDDE